MQHARIVVGHGSRSAESAAAFQRFVQDYAARHPQEVIRFAYLQLAQPTLESVMHELAQECAVVTLLPLFLFAAGHVKNDIPLLVARAERDFPNTRFVIAQPLGVHLALAELLCQRLHEALGTSSTPPGTVVAVVGRGCSDRDANAQLAQLVRLFAEQARVERVELCFEAVATPSVSQCLDWLLRGRPRHLVLLPYLLFDGVLVTRLREQAAKVQRAWPWVSVSVADPLGLAAPLQDVFDERVQGALSGEAPLPCATCDYRAPLARGAAQADGLSALLYSVRHSLTHSQAPSHEHAHRPVRKHVLVCGNVDCSARGSLRLIGELRRTLKARGLEREVKVTRTSCMGQCGEGPTVAVYPDGVWYRNVTSTDAERLTAEHLIAGRLVPELVDHIMT